MKTLSNLIGKPIISIYNGKTEGYVKNILFDTKLNKICFLQFFDDKTQEEKLLPAKNIFNVGQDAITIKNNSVILLDTINTSNYASPVNYEVYTIEGNKVGKIIDIELENTNNVKRLILQNKTHLLTNQILQIGENIVFLKNSQNKVTVNNFKDKTKITKSKQNIKVELQNNTSLTNYQKPNKLLGNYDFLIGRKNSKNIYADNGALIVKKQTKITTLVIEMVCKYGKLKELASNSI